MAARMIDFNDYIRNLWHPLLLAAFPAVFLFHNNASVVSFSSLILPLALMLGVGVLIYSALLLLGGGEPLRAGNAALGILAAFVLYGPVRDGLRQLDIVEVRDLTFLPGVLLAGLYLARYFGSLRATSAEQLRGAARVALGALIAYHAIGIVAAELRRAQPAETDARASQVSHQVDEIPTRRDVYYIILDEFAGLEAARAYWGDEHIGEFEGFLAERGFHVSAGSRSSSIDSLVEMASRLNFEQYKLGLAPQVYFDAIAANRAMREMESLGYETIVFDGMRAELFYPAKTPVRAEVTLEHASETTTTSAWNFDPFANMVLNFSLLGPFLDVDAHYGPSIAQHIAELRFVFDALGNVGQPETPQFIYAHIMLPHEPFVFAESGDINEPECHLDWHCYYGSYLYAMSLVEGLVDRLLDDADPENLPIIVLQSDHGARNSPYMSAGEGVLPNYPDEYAYSILNALYLPGVDYAKLPDDLAPIDTIPLILNLYFGYQLPLQ